jgi:hypothetical protein
MKQFGKILIVALATLVAGTAAAQCPQSATNSGLGTTGSMNLINDGTTSTVLAQAFTVECDAQFLTMEFGLAVYGFDAAGVRSLQTGDALRAYLMDSNRNVIGHTDHVLTFDGGSQWVDFDLGHRTFALSAGTYHVAIESLEPAWGAVITANGLGVDGSLWYDTGSGWTENTADDLYVRITWDENGVPNDSLAWGAMKASYR